MRNGVLIAASKKLTSFFILNSSLRKQIFIKSRYQLKSIMIAVVYILPSSENDIYERNVKIVENFQSTHELRDVFTSHGNNLPKVNSKNYDCFTEFTIFSCN